MRRKTIEMVKVIWDCSGQEQVTWETEARMKAEFPEWYQQFSMEGLGSDSRTNPYQGRLVMSLILDSAFGHSHGARRCTSQVTRPKDKRIMAVQGWLSASVG